jgi:putative DNA methylase
MAYLIELCALVYPQKYGREDRRDLAPGDLLKGEVMRGKNRLAGDVERWGKWVLEEARKDIVARRGSPAC